MSSDAPSATPTRAALRAIALQSLINQGLSDSSLSPSSIVSVDRNILEVKIAGEEFKNPDGSFSRDVLVESGHVVSRVSAEMMINETSENGRQDNQCAHIFVIPLVTEEIWIRGQSVQYGKQFFQLEFTARVKRDGVWVEIADGTSSLYYVDPDFQVVYPASLERRHRRPKKASKRAPVVQPAAPDAPSSSSQEQQPSTSDVMVTASSVVALPTAPPAKKLK